MAAARAGLIPEPSMIAFLALVLSAPPAAALEDLRAAEIELGRAFPAAERIAARHGGIEHLSRIAVPRLAKGISDEENARRFLAAHGRAFGIADADAGAGALELVELTSLPGRDGSARFRRLLNGFPVFGGDVVVGWRADG